MSTGIVVGAGAALLFALAAVLALGKLKGKAATYAELIAGVIVFTAVSVLL